MPRLLFFAVSLWMQGQFGPHAIQGSAPADVQPNVQPDSVAVAPPMSTAEAAGRFGLTLTTTPETVTVGDHFTVTVRVHLPAAFGPTIQFPAGADTSAQDAVTSIGTGPRHDSAAGGYVDATETYELAAWDVGTVPVKLTDLIIGRTHITLASRPIFVRSVLPKDATARMNAQPKAPRPLFRLIVIVRRVARQTARDHWLILTLLALILVGLLVWRRTRSRPDTREAALIDWAKWAKREFERIEAMHLVEKGEPEQHAILMTNVLRESLVHQFPAVRASATTRELAAVLQRESLIPATRILQLFERVDLFKFAGLDSESVEATTIGLEDEAIVDEIEQRRQGELAARAAAAAAAAEAKKAKGAA